MVPSFIERSDGGKILTVELVWGDLEFKIHYSLKWLSGPCYRCACGWLSNWFQAPTTEITAVYHEVATHCNTAHYGQLDLEGWLLKSEPYLLYSWAVPVALESLYAKEQKTLKFHRVFKHISNLGSCNLGSFTFEEPTNLMAILAKTGFCYKCGACGWESEPYETKSVIPPDISQAIEEHINKHKWDC